LFAIWISLAVVLIAFVASCEIFVPGCGSNVSSWLGPPDIHSTMSDLAGVPRGLFSAARANRSASGVSQAMPERPNAAPRAERREKWAGEPQLGVVVMECRSLSQMTNDQAPMTKQIQNPKYLFLH
jgi:hypothetical protein